jgi:hypothetical protein
MKRLMVYTAAFGDRDKLQWFPEGDFDSAVFTDDHTASSPRTKVIYLPEPFHGDPRRTARFFKLLPQLFFHDYEYTLWVDANVVLKEPVNVDDLIECLDGSQIAASIHRERKCIYEEARACIEDRLDHTRTIEKQVKLYRREGYPENNGLSDTGAVLRKVTPETNNFNVLWWDEVSMHSKRDQISFNYVAWKTNMRIAPFPGKTWDNQFFEKKKHYV